MARKAIIDRDKVLQMLREGQTTQRVADYFGVTRQAVDIHRKEFIAHGQLADQRASRSDRATISAAVQPPMVHAASAVQSSQPTNIPVSLQESQRELVALPLDQIIDLTIDAFAALKKLPAAEAERDRYRKSYEEASAEIERLKATDERRRSQEQRWFHTQD